MNELWASSKCKSWLSFQRYFMHHAAATHTVVWWRLKEPGSYSDDVTLQKPKEEAFLLSLSRTWIPLFSLSSAASWRERSEISQKGSVVVSGTGPRTQHEWTEHVRLANEGNASFKSSFGWALRGRISSLSTFSNNYLYCPLRFEMFWSPMQTLYLFSYVLCLLCYFGRIRVNMYWGLARYCNQ